MNFLRSGKKTESAAQWLSSNGDKRKRIGSCTLLINKKYATQLYLFPSPKVPNIGVLGGVGKHEGRPKGEGTNETKIIWDVFKKKRQGECLGNAHSLLKHLKPRWGQLPQTLLSILISPHPL
uniref:Uncharacterized protein n=1 Tax=Rhizophora mucronata TaxID=61149 RepID=A0A2P2N5H8_RHIMU